MTAASGGVAAALAWLRGRGSKRTRDGMARYGIVAPQAWGVPVGTIRAYAKRLGRDHDLAAGLWASGWYEARLLAAFVDDPACVTPGQMDRWARAFDNWAVCDTVCFHLFDRTPYAWAKVQQWAPRQEEFVRRAAFALLASLVVHDKGAPDARYRAGLRLIERAARDDRNFVKKAVNWALRCIGKRNAALHRAALATARRLAAAAAPAPRWIGRDALRELDSAAVRRRLAGRRVRAAAAP